jgi:hypothetical protein
MPVRGPLDMIASHIGKRTYTSAMQMLGPYLLVEKKGSKHSSVQWCRGHNPDCTINAADGSIIKSTILQLDGGEESADMVVM